MHYVYVSFTSTRSRICNASACLLHFCSEIGLSAWSSCVSTSMSLKTWSLSWHEPRPISSLTSTPSSATRTTCNRRILPGFVVFCAYFEHLRQALYLYLNILQTGTFKPLNFRGILKWFSVYILMTPSDTVSEPTSFSTPANRIVALLYQCVRLLKHAWICVLCKFCNQ